MSAANGRGSLRRVLVSQARGWFGLESDQWCCHRSWCAAQPSAGNVSMVRKTMEMQWLDVWPNAVILLWLAVAVGCGLNCADAAFVNHPVRNVLHLFPTCQIICIVITIRADRNDGQVESHVRVNKRQEKSTKTKTKER